MAQKMTDDKKEDSAGFGWDDLNPPPYWIMMRPSPSAPSGLEAALMPDPGRGEVPAAAAGSLAVLPETVEPP